MRVELGDFQPRPQGVMAIHAEIDLNGCLNIVDIGTGGKVTIPGHSAEEVGVYMSVDTVRDAAGLDASTELPPVLETLHETEKKVFFGLLQGSTMERLGPRYPATH